MVKVFCNSCNRTFKDESGLVAHNSAKHGNETSTGEKKGYSPLFYLGLIVLVGILLYVLFFQTSASAYNPDGDNYNPSLENAQKITIGMKNYNYYPNTIKVKVNLPVEITLDSSVKGCYRSFSVPKFKVNKYSQDSGDKIIFTPSERGVFVFRCGMGMGTGTLVVE